MYFKKRLLFLCLILECFFAIKVSAIEKNPIAVDTGYILIIKDTTRRRGITTNQDFFFSKHIQSITKNNILSLLKQSDSIFLLNNHFYFEKSLYFEQVSTVFKSYYDYEPFKEYIYDAWNITVYRVIICYYSSYEKISNYVNSQKTAGTKSYFYSGDPYKNEPMKNGIYLQVYYPFMIIPW